MWQYIPIVYEHILFEKTGSVWDNLSEYHMKNIVACYTDNKWELHLRYNCGSYGLRLKYGQYPKIL